MVLRPHLSAPRSAAIAICLLTHLAAQQFQELPRTSPVGGGIGKVFSADVADIDGDGDLDLVVDSWSHVRLADPDYLYVNDGHGRFTNASTPMPRRPSQGGRVRFADIDRDGDPDLLVADHWFDFFVYVNDGLGRFTLDPFRLSNPIGPTYDMVLGDVNGDGAVDVLAFRGAPVFLVNDGRGVLQHTTGALNWVHGHGPNAAVLVDLDGDGRDELLTATADELELWANDGTGRFRNASARITEFRNAGSIAGLAAGDVDADGDADVIVGIHSRALHLLRNDGSGSLRYDPAAMPINQEHPVSLRLFDGDLDGDLDLVVGNWISSEIPDRFYLNDGTGRFRDDPTRFPDTQGHTRELCVGDFDGDGDPDVIAVEGCTGTDIAHLYTNLHRHAYAPAVPRIGQPWTVELFAEPGYATAPAVVVPMLASRAVLAGIALPPLGRFYLDPATTVLLPLLVTTFPAGRATLQLPVPPVSAFEALPVYLQPAVFHGTTTPRLGNLLDERIKR